MLSRHVLHGDAARDRQTVRMVGDTHARMAEGHARAGHGLDPFGAVAPRRVHLEIAAKCRLRNDRRVASTAERLFHRELTQEMPAERAAATQPSSPVWRPRSQIQPSRDVPVSTSSPMTRALDGPMNATSRSVPASTRSETEHRQCNDRLCRALIAQLRPLVRLQGRHVVEQPGSCHVDVGQHGRTVLFARFSPPACRFWSV